MDVPVAIPINLPESLDHDTPCIHCGYNLRGLETTGRCPECGSPVVDSTRGDLLRFANPKWLERLRFGTSLKLWNIAITFILSFAAGIVVALGIPPVVTMFVAIIGGTLGLLATFAITTQEPRITLQEDPFTLRRVIRGCALAVFFNMFVAMVDADDLPGTILMIINVVCQLLGVVVVFGELLYYRRFALRIPDLKLAQSTKLLMWVLPVGVAMFLIIGFVVTMAAAGARPAPAPGTMTPGPGIFLMTSACAVGLFLLAGVLWYVRLLTKYNKAFKEELAQAKIEGSMLHKLARGNTS